MRLATTLFSVLALSAFVACGGGGDDSTGDDDPSLIDAADNPDPPDAADNPGYMGIGQTCTPDAQNPMGQGDCPAGFTCLNLTGASGPWCSKTCTTNEDCSTGYTGPGIAGCIFAIRFEEGGTPVNYCGVICEDLAGDPQVCNPETACTGECPGALQCTAPLAETQNGPAVANGCL